MSLVLLVDMNLSPDWVQFLQKHAHSAFHWSTVGDIRAHDPEIMDCARSNKQVILTHDLDFGTLLAQTHATGPSVVLIRAQDPSHEVIGDSVAAALAQCESDLLSGALVVVDPAHHRVRILPI